MITHFSLFPTPTCPENIFPLPAFTPDICKWICDYGTTAYTSRNIHLCRSLDFVDLLYAISITPTSSTWKSGPYFLMKHRQQREFKLSVMKAFGVSGISGACLGKNGMHFGYLSSLDFLLSPYRPTPLCSLSTPKWNLLSNLKVLWIVS